MKNSAEKLNTHGKRGIIRELAVIIFGAILLFTSAGALDWIRGWIYISIISIYQVVYISILLAVNPQL